ncbi:MAG TPA: 50S ribosomal protein L6 [Candidatus Saccharimonadales bacterium]
MSRIGRQAIQVPSGVEVTLVGSRLKVKGPKGELDLRLPKVLEFKSSAGKLELIRQRDSKTARSLHGLTRANLQNAIKGVNEGYSLKLEISGVGFKAQATTDGLSLNLGLSHVLNYQLPAGVMAAVDQSVITITGIDKQQVGQVAAEIRAFKKPEPYKGKGIKLSDEYVIRKAGKAAATAKE